ncbi:cupin domain-containing protein [Candidatus Aerophobetes bacterium]|nr:cupin domain-containing protein [Candidatus Aerophobetes bacterium]
MIVKDIKNGKDYRWSTHINSLLIDRKDTEGTEVFLTKVEPKKSVPQHTHNDNEQLYYVIEGEGLINYRSPSESVGKKVKIKAGQIVFIPLKTEHQIICVGEKPLIYLTIDVFPKGKPPGEPTWDAHAKNLAINDA